MRTYNFILVILAILCISACSSGKSDKIRGDIFEDYDYKTEVIDGIKTIINPAEPFKGRIEMNMVEEVSIGVDEGEEPYMLVGPVDVKADSEGRIYIMDWRDIGIRVFDKEGHYIRTIGRKGQGPAEFDSPTLFDLSDDGRIFLMDSRNQRITVLDIEGKPLNDFKVIGFYSQMACDAQNRLYIQNQTRQKEIAVSDNLQEIPLLTGIHRVDPNSGEMFKLGDFEGDKSMMLRTETGVMLSVSSSSFTWRIHPLGKLYIGLSEIYQFSVYSEGGELEFRFTRDYTPVPRPKARAGTPKFYSAFDVRRPRFDEDHNIWLELFTEEDFEGILYDVFTSDGLYLKQVVVPHRIYHFKNGRVYSLLRTEDEYLRVKRFRLEENPTTGDDSII